MLCPNDGLRPPPGNPCCPAASTKHWFSIARARSSGSQCAMPVSSVKFAGTLSTSAPAVGELAVELREAQVVADGQADRQAGELGDHRVGAGRRPVGLAIGDPADVDVEQVDLRVRGGDGAVRGEHDRHIADARAVARALDGDAAADQVDAVLARPAGQRVDGLAAVEPLGVAGELRPVGDGVPLLGQQHQLGPAGGGARDQRRHPLDVLRLVGPGDELDAGCQQGVHEGEPTASSSIIAVNAWKAATNRITLCSTAIIMPPSDWSSSGVSPHRCGVVS